MCVCAPHLTQTSRRACSIGRSGRFGRKGVALNLVNDQKSRQDLEYIARFFHRDVINLPNDIEEIEKRVKESLK